MADTETRLASMNDLDDFEIEKGDPDPRGWTIRGSDGMDIGTVDELIVDTTAMKVRYLNCDVDENLDDTGEDRHVLIPVGYARLDEDDRVVNVGELASTEVAAVPAYTGAPLAREDEERLHTAYGGTWEEEEVVGERPVRDRETGEATVTRAEEEVTVGKRDVRAGEVEVDKDVETEHVTKPVTTKHEEVEVERRAASGRAGEADFDEEEVRIPVSEEEVVVEKQPEVKEEVVVKKREVEETENVEADVRKERVDVKEEGRLKEER